MNDITTICLDGPPGVGKTSILQELEKHENVFTIREPENEFLHVLTEPPNNISDILWSANAVHMQLTVMDAIINVYNNTRIPGTTKYLFLERNLDSAKNIFTRLLHQDDRFNAKSKVILENCLLYTSPSPRDS